MSRETLRPSTGSGLLGLALVLGLVAGLFGCSGAEIPGIGGDEEKVKVPLLATSTCWSADVLGADRQAIKDAAEEAGLDQVLAEAVMANRPAFSETRDCAADHALEVYRVVELPGLAPRLTSYAALLRTDLPLYRQLSRRVQRACMEPVLARAAARSKLPGTLMEPALPVGMHLNWAPPSPAQFAEGQRVFACVFDQADPSPVRYSRAFARTFPTALRTCILSKGLLYVDCAREHDRERIAVLQVRLAVQTGAFPGRKAIKKGPRGRYLDASPAKYAALDAACTAYLRSISTTGKLTGIAEIDLDYWPAKDGSYPIVCEADTRPNQQSLITKGSVYNRAGPTSSIPKG